MMPAQPLEGPRSPMDRLIEKLPAVRGRYVENVSLADVTWFRVGGPAEILFRPADDADLAEFLARKPTDVPVTVIGVASNLLVRDGGVPGVVVRLGSGFGTVDFTENQVRVGAALLDIQVATAARRQGRTGLEFLNGIPGTIGGGLRMNAGAYGSEFKDALISAEAIDAQGQRHVLSPAEMGLTYRHSETPADWIFVAATFKSPGGDADTIAAQMARIKQSRENSQPIRERTGGSTFANPDGGKAWQLIDGAGCRGLRIGGAMVSKMHCNFLINTDNATAADLEILGEEIRRRVFEESGIKLRWEIRRIGVPIENGLREFSLEDPA